MAKVERRLAILFSYYTIFPELTAVIPAWKCSRKHSDNYNC